MELVIKLKNWICTNSANENNEKKIPDTFKKQLTIKCEESKSKTHSHVLLATPTLKDLMRYSKVKLKKKRMLKKFLKDYSRYLPSQIWIEYIAKCMVAPIRMSLNYAEIGRNLFMVEELPQGGYASYVKKRYSRDYSNLMLTIKS